jgi:hypothetical protein
MLSLNVSPIGLPYMLSSELPSQIDVFRYGHLGCTAMSTLLSSELSLVFLSLDVSLGLPSIVLSFEMILLSH